MEQPNGLKISILSQVARRKYWRLPLPHRARLPTTPLPIKITGNVFEVFLVRIARAYLMVFGVWSDTLRYQINQFSSVNLLEVVFQLSGLFALLGSGSNGCRILLFWADVEVFLNHPLPPLLLPQTHSLPHPLRGLQRRTTKRRSPMPLRGPLSPRITTSRLADNRFENGSTAADGAPGTAFRMVQRGGAQ